MHGCELREVFEAAHGYRDYVARIRVHRRYFDEVYRHLACAAELPPVFGAGTRILVLCEPYCADCIFNLPLIARLVEACPGAVLRIASRDRHLRLAEKFPGRSGCSRVPTVILLDGEWQPVGYWSERSGADHAWFAEFVRTDPFPGIILEGDLPAGAFAPWLQRRLDQQLPVFTDRTWRDVRQELLQLGSQADARATVWRDTGDGAFAARTAPITADGIRTGDGTLGAYAIVYRPGPAWKRGHLLSEQDLGPHVQYMTQLVQQGMVQVAGPLPTVEGGLVLLRASSLDAAQEVMAHDPAVRNRQFVGFVSEWKPVFDPQARFADAGASGK